jgi:hypothetical protein
MIKEEMSHPHIEMQVYLHLFEDNLDQLKNYRQKNILEIQLQQNLILAV